MLKELENETKKTKMEVVPRCRAKSASASRPKLRQFIPNEVIVNHKQIISKYNLYKALSKINVKFNIQ